jgi:hypothetical protein
MQGLVSFPAFIEAFHHGINFRIGKGKIQHPERMADHFDRIISCLRNKGTAQACQQNAKNNSHASRL